MMIDMHAHWKPSEVADALRARTREPREAILHRNAAAIMARVAEGMVGAKVAA